jgi:hypothetical protein
MLPFEGDRTPWPFVVTPYLEGGVSFSADGNWVSYASDDTGQCEVVVRAFPEAEPAHQVSTGGGIEVVWPMGSKDLFYRSGDKRMAEEITTGPTLTVGTARVLFEGNFMRSPGSREPTGTLPGTASSSSCSRRPSSPHYGSYDVMPKAG